MLKTMLIAGALAMACLHAPACADTLVLAATEYPPYYSEALPRGGPVTELTVTALRRAGHVVQVRFLPWARALRLGELGEVDGLIGIWHSPERERHFLYSRPVAHNHVVLCHKPGTGPKRFTGFPALKPYTVGVVRGDADPPGLTAAGIRTDAVNDDLQNLRKLSAGRIDLVLVDSRVARYLASRHLPQLAATMQCLEPSVQEHPQYLVVSRHLATAAAVVAEFNEQLKRMQDSGEFAEIAARWGF